MVSSVNAKLDRQRLCQAPQRRVQPQRQDRASLVEELDQGES